MDLEDSVKSPTNEQQNLSPQNSQPDQEEKAETMSKIQYAEDNNEQLDVRVMSVSPNNQHEDNQSLS